MKRNYEHPQLLWYEVSVDVITASDTVISDEKIIGDDVIGSVFE